MNSKICEEIWTILIVSTVVERYNVTGPNQTFYHFICIRKAYHKILIKHNYI